MPNKTYEKGLKNRREVLGAEYVDNAIASADDFSRPLQELVTEYCWGAVWDRPGLDRKTRSIINLAMLTALNRPHELKLHIKGALNNGLSKAEIGGGASANRGLLRRARGRRQLSQRARGLRAARADEEMTRSFHRRRSASSGSATWVARWRRGWPAPATSFTFSTRTRRRQRASRRHMAERSRRRLPCSPAPPRPSSPCFPTARRCARSLLGRDGLIEQPFAGKRRHRHELFRSRRDARARRGPSREEDRSRRRPGLGRRAARAGRLAFDDGRRR